MIDFSVLPSQDKIYYQDSETVIYCGDAMEIAPLLPRGELLLTDPPYGIGEDSETQRSRAHLADPTDYGDYHWDKKISRELLYAAMNTAKNQAIFGGNYYADWLPASSCWLVWDKDNSGDFADCELVWTSFPTAVRKFKWRWNGFIQQDMKHKERRVHPTQKPTALIEWIITHYTQPGDLVIDTFGGSGTTNYCAKKLGRKSISIEINPDYCKIEADRLASVSVTDNYRRCYICGALLVGKRVDARTCSARCRVAMMRRGGRWVEPDKYQSYPR